MAAAMASRSRRKRSASMRAEPRSCSLTRLSSAAQHITLEKVKCRFGPRISRCRAARAPHRLAALPPGAGGWLGVWGGEPPAALNVGEGGAGDVAVNVELHLIVGPVAHADRARAAVAGEVAEFLLPEI